MFLVHLSDFPCTKAGVTSFGTIWVLGIWQGKIVHFLPYTHEQTKLACQGTLVKASRETE